MVDGTAIPVVSPKIAVSMSEAVQDVQDNCHRHTAPVHICIGNKDIIVDNKGAQDFFKKCATPDKLKSLKQFYNCYHQIHKEPQYRAEYFGSCFDFITKVINHHGADSKLSNWKGLPKFEAGRPKGARSLVQKRKLVGLAAIAYLAFGFMLWLLLKIFSSSRNQYAFKRVVLKWPLIFKAFFDILKTPVIKAKMIGR